MAAVALLAACSERGGDISSTVPQEVALKLQAPSSAATRTWIDAAGEGTTAPVYWSDGDRIAVNGVISSALAVEDGQKLASATFFLRNVEAPYSAVYPSGAWAGTDPDGNILLDIPAVQAWTEGSFAPGSALLYGSSASAEEPVAMSSLCGAITFTLRDPDEVQVGSLSITSLTDDKPIAGRFALDTETLELTPAGEVGGTVSMALPQEGLSLSAAGTSFFFSLPAGSYSDGFLIRLDDARKHILRKFWLRPSAGADPGINLEAGTLVVFEAQEYDPDAREICSAADWEEFAAALNGSAADFEKEWVGKDGSIKIGADFEAAGLTRLTSFSGVLDGCGHTVTLTNATSPLVGTLTGTIRNLTVAGTNNPADPDVIGASVFVSSLNGGTIENCVNKANIIAPQKAKNMISGAFVRTMTGGSILNCVNEGNISLTCDVTSTSFYLMAGGFVAQVKDLTAAALIKNCVNKGKITVTAVRELKTGKAIKRAGYGGIVACIISGSADKYLTIESCTNEGDIAVDYSPVPSAGTTAAVSGAGGILGLAMEFTSEYMFKWNSYGSSQLTSQDGVYFKMVSCTSKGNVHNGLCCSVAHGDPNSTFAAGLVGVANGLGASPALIQDCTVENISVEATTNSHYERNGFCMVSAGLAGFAGNATFKDCDVTGCRIGTLKRQSYLVAGGIGMAPVTFTMDGCRIFADIQQIRCKFDKNNANKVMDGHFAMGFCLSTKKGPTGGPTVIAGEGGFRNTFVNPEGSEVKNCSFGGTITVNTDPTSVYYQDSTWPAPTSPITLTASNFGDYIACGTFTRDFYERNVPDMVTISDNQWWNGQ